MIMQLINEWLPLRGIDSPGTYVVRANKATVEFTLVLGADGELRVSPDPGPIPEFPHVPVPGFVVPDGQPPHVDGLCEDGDNRCTSPASPPQEG